MWVKFCRMCRNMQRGYSLSSVVQKEAIRHQTSPTIHHTLSTYPRNSRETRKHQQKCNAEKIVGYTRLSKRLLFAIVAHRLREIVFAHVMGLLVNSVGVDVATGHCKTQVVISVDGMLCLRSADCIRSKIG